MTQQVSSFSLVITHGLFYPGQFWKRQPHFYLFATLLCILLPHHPLVFSVNIRVHSDGKLSASTEIPLMAAANISSLDHLGPRTCTTTRFWVTHSLFNDAIKTLGLVWFKGTYACLIISSTGVCAAWRGSTRGAASAACCTCLLYCLTDDMRFRKRGTNVPQPPSLNRILNVCVEYRALCSFSGTTWIFSLHAKGVLVK